MNSENQNETNESGDNLDDFFGAAKSGGSDINWKTHALSDKGEPNIFRIAPPIKSLKEVGRWNVYDRIHYGYTVPNDQNPDKPRARPFRCIEKKNRATNMIEQDCPECAFLAAKNDEVEKIVARLVAEGKSPADAEEYVRGAKKLLKDHSLEKKYYMLAKNLAGEWGTLKLGYRAFTALQDARTKFMKENGGVDPLDARKGVWFEFTRQGKGLDTRYTATIAMENLGGGRYQFKSGALTALDIDALKKCPDLAKINDSRNLGYDQILALVRSGGDPEIVASVFGQARRVTTPAPTAAATPPPVVQAPAQIAAPAPIVPPQTTQKLAAQDDEVAALRAKLAALEAAQAKPAAPPAPKAAPVAQAPVEDLMKLDPQQFLAMFPDPNKK